MLSTHQHITSAISEELKLVSETKVFGHILLSTHGTHKTVVTVGTRHGEDCKVQIGLFLEKMSNEAYSILLEKPSIQDIGLDIFTGKCFDNSGQDHTQNDIATRHATTLQSRGVEMLGVDGRKIFLEDYQNMSIALEHKLINVHYQLSENNIVACARDGRLLDFAINIINACLGIDETTINYDHLQFLSDLVVYKDDTQSEKILRSFEVTQ